MPTLKRCVFGFIGMMILFSSCTPRYFYASRINFYSFDTCRQIKVIVEPYLTGFSGAIAFSPLNHFAISADVNSQSSSDGHNASTFGGGYPQKETSGSQYDLSIGYFKKFNSDCGVDLFVGFGHQKVSGIDSVINENTDYGTPLSFDKEYNIFSLQPSFYFSPHDGGNVAIGCKVGIVSEKFDSQQMQMNTVAGGNFHFEDILIEPGLEVSPGYESWIRFGLYGHFSANGKLYNENLRPFTFSVKLTPKFGKTKRYSNFMDATTFE